ncbi:MAG: DUF1761 domain-containing protein [Candidatus Paceibacterota bacterium]|jgi:hypothetical protein
MSLLAIVLAVIVVVALGMLWYSPVMFSRQWMELSGIDPVKAQANSGKMWKSYAGNIALTAVTAFVVYAILAVGFQIMDLFALWSAFALPVFAGGVFWGGKPLKLFLIEAGYSLVSLAFMAQVILWVA